MTNTPVKNKYCMGVDIGGTKCAVILGYSDIRRYKKNAILKKIIFPTEKAIQTIDKIIEKIDELLREFTVGTNELEGIGISCGGPLDSDNGIILSPPNLIGWDGIPIVNILSDHFGVPAKLENDANACALAEWQYGAGQGCQNMIFLTFGTGLGAGLIINNMLFRGSCGMAGEVGHIRLDNHGPVGYGKSGSFEGFCSGGGIAQLARDIALERLQMGTEPVYCPSISDLPVITAKSVADSAFAGDQLAKEVFIISGKYLGRGLAILIDILNPERIIIGSVYVHCEALLRTSMETALNKESLMFSRRACVIIPSALGDNIGDIAALNLAKE